MDVNLAPKGERVAARGVKSRTEIGDDRREAETFGRELSEQRDLAADRERHEDRPMVRRDARRESDAEDKPKRDEPRRAETRTATEAKDEDPPTAEDTATPRRALYRLRQNERDAATHARDDARSEETSLASALGINGLIMERVTPGVASTTMGLLGGGFASGAAKVVNGLVAEVPGSTLQGGTATKAGDVGALLGQLDGAARQDTLTSELARLLSVRHGALPNFSLDTAGRGAPKLDLLTLTQGSATEPAPIDEQVAQTSAAATSSTAVIPPENGVAAGAVEGLAAAAMDATGQAPSTSPVSAVAAQPGVSTVTPAVPTAPVVAHAQSVLPLDALGVTESTVLRQITDGVKLMSEAGRHTAEIRLDPAELGKVAVRLEIEGQSVRMFVTTELAGVRDLMSSGLERLRQDLLAQGLQTTHVEIRHDANGFGQQHQGGSQDQSNDDAMVLHDEPAAPATPRAPSRPRDGSRIHLTA